MGLVSVVIPIYNVELYLERCISSVLEQSYTNIELLLINDGSTDNSAKIIDDYHKIYSRIKVCHKANAGVSSARNVGIEMSTGEFLLFIDPDDYLPKYSIENMLLAINSTGADIAVGNHQFVGQCRGKVCKVPRTIYTQEEYINALLCKKMTSAVWGKLYRRALFFNEPQSRFINIKKGEDFLFSIDVAFFAQLIISVPEIVYYYYQRPDSTIHRFKTTIDYEKKYDLFMTDIIKQHRVNNEFECGLIHFNISQLQTLIIDQIPSLLKDEWVSNIIQRASAIKLSWKEKLILLCVRNRSISLIINQLRKYIQ